MNETTQEIAVATSAKAPVLVGKNGIVISDMDSLWRFSKAVQSSGLAPKGIQSTEAIFVAIQMGLEVGLTPMAALQNIAVINGRPSIWGDAQLAVVRGTGELEVFEEWFESQGKRLPRNPTHYTDDTCAVCRVKRRGYEPTEISFGVSDAKSANLWGKDGPWKQYPWRMLRMRARSFALRDGFGDALRGMRSVEENQDLPPVETSSHVEVRVSPIEPKQIGETAIAEEPKPHPRLAAFRSWLAENNVPEGSAVTRIHGMFSEASGCNTLDEVDSMFPNIMNALNRPTSRKTFIEGIAK